MNNLFESKAEHVPGLDATEFAAFVSEFASTGVDVLVLDSTCRPLAGSCGAVEELLRQDALAVRDGCVMPVEERQQASFSRYVGVSAGYSVEGRQSLVCLAVARHRSGPGAILRIELTPGSLRRSDHAGTCLAVLRS